MDEEKDQAQEQPEPEIHVPDYVYEEIGPSFTPRLILQKENQELFRKR